MRTQWGRQWSIDVPHIVSGKGNLNGPNWLHCHTTPLLAALLNPTRANISNLRMFKGDGYGRCPYDNNLNLGFSQMVLTEEIQIPNITLIQHVKFAILCARQVCIDSEWNVWTDVWLSGEDRSPKTLSWAFALAENSGEFVAIMAVNAAIRLQWTEELREIKWAEKGIKLATNRTIYRTAIVLPTIDFAALAEQAVKEET